MRLELKPEMMQWLKEDMENHLLEFAVSMQDRLNAQYIIGKIVQHQQGKRTILLPKITYDCPRGHKINVNNFYREIHCEFCDRFYKKAECIRFRHYDGGKKAVYPMQKKDYSHEYYLKRKMGFCKRQKHPFRDRIKLEKSNE